MMQHGSSQGCYQALAITCCCRNLNSSSDLLSWGSCFFHLWRATTWAILTETSLALHSPSLICPPLMNPQAQSAHSNLPPQGSSTLLIKVNPVDVIGADLNAYPLLPWPLTGFRAPARDTRLSRLGDETSFTPSDGPVRPYTLHFA